jgi:hypothetical protein
LACNASAQTYYRSVDAEGNVTYSANPPVDAAQVAPVEVQPGPSDEEVKRAVERQQRFEAQLGEAEEKRAQMDQDREDKVKAAEEAVEQAERDLLDAKKTRGVDYLSGGALAQYQERVQAAEEALDKAKQDLRKVRSGRP